MKLLIAGSLFLTETYLRSLHQIGIETICCEREDGALQEEAYSADAIICNWLFIHHPIEKFRNLKWIQLLSAGTDRVPIDYIQERGITLCTARGVYSIPMAEFAISGVLQLMKHSMDFYDQKKACIWNKLRNVGELNGKNVLIVGCGSVGTEIAKRFSAFTDNVSGVDIYVPANYSWFREIRGITSLDQSLVDADIVILTLPLNEQTRHLFNSERFAFMKKGSILVNIARGGIVDESALINALKAHLFGAVLDVFEKEPLPADSPFWKMDNVVLSPHNSFVSEQNEKRLWEVCITNITQYMEAKEDKI